MNEGRENLADMNILVVDDTRTQLRVLTKILKERGYTVRPVLDPKLALESARTAPPDMILLDIMMPDISGYDLCEQLKADERTRDIPVIFVSALANMADKVRAFAVGGVDYIPKPFNAKEVLARVETHLALRNLQKELETKNAQLEREIGEHREARIALQESEVRYRAVSEMTSDLAFAFCVDAQGELVMEWMTDSLTRITGFSLDEAKMRADWVDFVHPDDKRTAYAEMREIKRGRRVKTELRIITKSGAARWLHIDAQPVWDEARNRVGRIIGAARDITARKDAEQEIVKAKEEWERTFDAVPDMITILDEKHRVLRANAAVGARLNIDLEKCMGQTCYSCLHGRDAPPEFCPHTLLLQDHKAHTVEVRDEYLKGDFVVSVSPLFDDEGRFFGSVHIARDITARKRMEDELQQYRVELEDLVDERTAELQQEIAQHMLTEEELRRSEEFNRSIIESSVDCIKIVDLEGRLRFMSEGGKRLMGITDIAPLLGMPYDEFWGDADKEVVRAALDAARNGNQGSFEAPLATYEGTVKWWSVMVSPIWEDDARVDRLLIVSRDITEQKEAEKRIRESELRYRALFENAPIGIGVATMDGAVIAGNDSILRYFGYTLEELQQFDLGSFYRDPQRRGELLAELREHGAVQDFEAELYRQDGSTFCANVNVNIIDLEGQRILLTMLEDITERKHTQNALRESEGRFRRLAENAKDMIYRMSLPDGRYEYVSPAAREISGYTPEEWYGTPELFQEILPPEWQTYFAERWTELLQGDMSPYYEYQIIHKSGEARWLNQRNVLIRGERGELVAIEGIVTDVTEQKRAEARLRLLLELTQAAVEAADLHSALEIVLRKVCKVTGWAYGEVWIPNEAGTALECAPIWYSIDEVDIAVFRENTETIQFEARVGLPGRVWMTKQPEWIPDVSAVDSAVFVRNQLAAKVGLKAGFGVPIIAHDDVLAVLTFFLPQARDEDWRLIELVAAVSTQLGQIIQRKRAEDALQESKESYQMLTELSRDMISLHDANGVYLYVSPVSQDILGYRPAELVGRGAYELFHPDDVESIAAHHRQVINKTMMPAIVYRIRRKDGAYIWLETTNRFIKNSETDAVERILCVSRDITERKRAQERLARSNAELRRFAYIASHDLQEPLRMVSIYTQMLEKRCANKLDADAVDFINYIVTGTERIQAMIKGLQAYLQVDRAKAEFAPTDSAVALNYALAELRNEIAESGAVVTHDELPTVLADERQLSQVFEYLIDNAIKFRGEEPPRIHVSAFSSPQPFAEHTRESAPQRGEGEWIFAVRDNGIGIDPAYFDRIFGIFRRLHAWDEYSGIGIGLTLCHKILERHGGRMWVESQQGEGATFYFALPREEIV